MVISFLLFCLKKYIIFNNTFVDILIHFLLLFNLHPLDAFVTKKKENCLSANNWIRRWKLNWIEWDLGPWIKALNEMKDSYLIEKANEISLKKRMAEADRRRMCRQKMEVREGYPPVSHCLVPRSAAVAPWTHGLLRINVALLSSNYVRWLVPYCRSTLGWYLL